MIARKKGDYYEIAFGERRLRASKIAGIKEIECEVRVLSDTEMYVLTSVENMFREDVDDIQRAEHFREMKNITKMSDMDLSMATGVPLGSITQLLGIDKLPQFVKNKIMLREIPVSTAVESFKKGGEKFVQHAIDNRMTREEVRSTLKEEVQEIISPTIKTRKTIEEINHTKMNDVISEIETATRAIQKAESYACQMTDKQMSTFVKTLKEHIINVQEFVNNHSGNNLK